MADNKENQDNNQGTNHLTKAQHDQIVNQGTGYEPSVPVKRTYLPLRKTDRLWGGVKSLPLS